MPLRCPFGELRGWLLLGPRPDGTRYSQDDLDALASIASPLQRALFLAREREKEKALDAANARATRRQLTDLAARIASLEAAIQDPGPKDTSR
jgi:hypothetical protein